jgi:DNA topoisomerase-3
VGFAVSPDNRPVHDIDELLLDRTDLLQQPNWVQHGPQLFIDGIATMAGQLIEIFRGHPGSTVDLDRATAATRRGRRRPQAASQRRPSKEPSAARAPGQRRSVKHAQPTASAGIALQKPQHHSGKTGGMPPTAKMVAYAKSLAGNNKVKLPPGYAQDFETCRRFLDQHAR